MQRMPPEQKPAALPASLQHLTPACARFCLRVQRFMENELALQLAGARVLVAFSGGADSTALLLALHYLAPRLGLDLAAAHVNHGLRPSAGEEMDACRRFAALLGIPFHSAAYDVSALSAQQKMGTEECARSLRYDFFSATAGQHGYAYIAVGHTLNDLAEDVLMRLVRGAGWPGLAGMSGLRPLAPAPDRGQGAAPLLVRPLLGARRAEVENFLGALGLGWITDESNLEPAYLRNRVRHEILPLCIRENPAFLDNIADLWRLGRIDAEYFKAVLPSPESLFPGAADKPVSTPPSAAGAEQAPLFLPSEQLAALPEALRLRLYKRCLQSLGPGQALHSGLLALDKAWLRRGRSGAKNTEHRFPGQKLALVHRAGITWVKNVPSAPQT